MVWKLQGSPSPASKRKTGLSASPQPLTHPPRGQPGQPSLWWGCHHPLMAHQSDPGLTASQKPWGAARAHSPPSIN